MKGNLIYPSQDSRINRHVDQRLGNFSARGAN